MLVNLTIKERIDLKILLDDLQSELELQMAELENHEWDEHDKRQAKYLDNECRMLEKFCKKFDLYARGIVRGSYNKVVHDMKEAEK